MLRLLPVLALVLSACSSTARKAEPSEPGRGTTPPPGASAGPSGAATASRSPEPGGQATSGTSASSSSRGSGSRSNSPAGGDVLIGINYSANIGPAFAAFGAGGVATDELGPIKAIVDWVNRHGGLGGKRLVPVYVGSDALDGQFAAQAEGACTNFTEDNKVFAVVSGSRTPSMNLVDCLAKHRTPLVWDFQYLLDRPTFDTYANYLYQPFSITADRLGIYVDLLAERGFFGSAPRIGVIRYDNERHERFTERILKPRLAAHGLSVTDEFALQEPRSASEATTTAAQASNAILRFKRETITHVLFAPSGGAIPFIFMPAAESQRFHPRYGLNSLDIPEFVQANVPASQLRGAQAVGWLPGSDVSEAYVPKGNPAEELCASIVKSHNDDLIRYCDGIFFLRGAFERMRDLGIGRPTVAALRSVAEGMGGSYNSPWTFRTRLGPGRHDGATAVRAVVFDDGCDCFTYVGGLRTIP